MVALGCGNSHERSVYVAFKSSDVADALVSAC